MATAQRFLALTVAILIAGVSVSLAADWSPAFAVAVDQTSSEADDATGPGDVVAGKKQFNTWCAGCHGPAGPGPDLLAPGGPGAGWTFETLLPLVRNGVGHGTPPGPYKPAELNDKQIRDLAAYIGAEAGPAPPQPNTSTPLASPQSTSVPIDAREEECQGSACPCPRSAPPRFLRAWGTVPGDSDQLVSPSGVAVAPDGTVYVVDASKMRLTYFDGDGTYLGEWGTAGSGEGQFDNPVSVALTPDGQTVYVTDAGNERIQYFDATGTFLGAWGREGSGEGEFGTSDTGLSPGPWGVAVAPNGTVYVTDTYNDRVQYFDARGTYLGQWGSQGDADGQCDRPAGVAVAPDGTVYVVDQDNNRVQHFSPTGALLGIWGAQRGMGPGEFSLPLGIAVAPDGQTIYVADTDNARVEALDTDGNYLRGWGSDLSFPVAVGVARDGDIYITSPGHGSIVHYAAGGGLRGEWGRGSKRDGKFNSPQGVAIAPDETVYVADTDNDRIQYFDASGKFLGTWGSHGTGDGEFNQPFRIAVAPNDTVYVTDTDNHRIQVFAADGSYQTQWGTQGTGDGQFYRPTGIAIAPDGTVYVVDANRRIQYFTATGRFLGAWGNSANRRINGSFDIAISPGGNTIYVTNIERGLQQFDATGTYLGHWGSFSSGEAQIFAPLGLSVAPDGTVYVTQYYDSNIKYFDPAGTFLGQWGAESGRIGQGEGEFWFPLDVAVAPDGMTVYVADTNNHRIQSFEVAPCEGEDK